ncbi:MAG: pimelyl-ACP methyl ester esterase BioV [Arcobacteraceae bacterium]|nr:pimelyl-ACP methyl ester esterase BioV [Arcobacteraceae bacterium]
MYFSGFSLDNEKELFKQYLTETDFTTSGFSFGAQKAIEYALNTQTRIDTLQLFSPSYFNDKDTKYKRMQLMYFKKDCQTYCDNFLNNCGISQEEKSNYFKMGTVEDLEDLLNYNWDEKKLQKIVDKGINIEVYLGTEDKIIDSNKALEFFLKFSEVYYIKNKGHIL